MLRSLWVVLLLSMGMYVMAEEQARSITVDGIGFAEVEPDRATIRMSIIARDQERAAAQKRAADVTNRVLKMTDRMDIARDQVDTTGASVRPDYRWNREKEEQELRGYIAERQIAVEIDDLEKLGVLVEGAVSSGVNQVSPPQLDSRKRRETYRRALRAAAEDAKANALQLADTLGAKLGHVISINSGTNAPRPPTPHAAGVRSMAVESDAVESYNAADLRFNAIVTVVFELTE
ncbi:MAG: SIMPL domain-containing protein [Woeseiaceae bacterium]|nr:SIMPL domain-containing protein [Woeseiaceae bacterium]MDX2609322.1 SIMPL domain-containing protein [Woeseiaceae bacterium]